MAWSMVLGPTCRACREIYCATKNCALGTGNPTCPRSCCQPLVHRARTPPLRNLLRGAPGQVGPCRLVAVASVRKQDRWPLYRTSAQLQRLRTRTLWEWDLGKAGGYCRSVLESPLSLQPTAPFQPRLPLQGPPSQSYLTGCLTWASISLHAVWDLCAPAAFWLRNQQQRSFNVAAGQAVANRCSRTEAPREEFACASRPLGTHHGRKRKILEAIAELPDPGEAVRTLAGAGGLRGSALADTANRAALRSRTGGATATAAVGEHRAVASGRRNKHFSTSHHLLTIISPCHPTHSTTLISDLLTVQFHSNPSASCQLGHRPRTFGSEMSREDDEHWEWVSTSAQSEAPADARRSKGAPEQGNSAHVGNPSRGTPQQERVGAVRSIIRRAVQRSSEERWSGQRAHPPSSPPRRQHSRRGQATHDQPRMRRAARQRSQQAQAACAQTRQSGSTTVA